MSKSRQKEPGHSGNVFRFTLTGLILFSVFLMAATAFIDNKLYLRRPRKLADTFAVDPKDKSRTVRVGPWGELVTRDIVLERPAELVTAEATTLGPEMWAFRGKKPDEVKVLLARIGVSDAQLATLFAPGAFQEDAVGTVLKPSPAFVMSLDPKSRQQLSTGLYGLGANIHLDFPLLFQPKIIESISADDHLMPEDVAVFKKLLYLNGDVSVLANYQTLMDQIPTAARRVAMGRAISRQVAVLAGLTILPDTDVDKIATYWGHLDGVRFNDIRPMLEALRRLPEGGSLSSFWLLPKFARDRLYTFPLPPQPGDANMDCNWSTYNFLNEERNGQLANSSNLVEFLNRDYYVVQSPSVCGDIFLLMNDQSQILHSAVYLADDLVFTKNGGAFNQPWMLMHIPDLLTAYLTVPGQKVIYMRKRTN